MKQLNPEKIILLKVGEFYYQYGKDSYIMSYIFSYKLKILETNIPFSSFSKAALNKVLTKLEEKNISYLIVNKSLNYEVIEKEEFKENRYQDYYRMSRKYVQRRNRIDNIYSYLMQHINDENIKEKIYKIEDVLNEI